MTAIGRILYVVPFDSTEAAISWQVMQLARAAHAEVVLFSARIPRWRPFGARAQREAIGLRLSEVATRMKGYAAEVRVVDGDPVEATLQAVRESGARLIMVGAGERSLAEPAHLDPEALELARRAFADVWICKPSSESQIQHVLCAADTSATAALAVRRAAGLCRSFNARLKLLSVMAEPSTLPPDEMDRELEDQRKAQKEFIDSIDLAGVAHSRSVVWANDPASEVLHEAELQPDGLLVIGASSRKRSDGLGLTSEPVLRRCPCSVWIVRQPPPERKKAVRPEPAGATSVATQAAPANESEPTG